MMTDRTITKEIERMRFTSIKTPKRDFYISYFIDLIISILSNMFRSEFFELQNSIFPRIHISGKFAKSDSSYFGSSKGF